MYLVLFGSQFCFSKPISSRLKFGSDEANGEVGKEIMAQTVPTFPAWGQLLFPSGTVISFLIL